MSLKEQIVSDLNKSLKSGDNLRRDTLRLIFSAVKNAEIEKKKKDEGLDDQEMIEIMKKLVKQRNDSIDLYEKGGRQDLAEKEKKEIEIISAYLPAQMDEKKIREEIKKIISETGTGSPSDFGKVMGLAMKNLKGQADGNLVKKIAEEELSKK